MKISLIVLTWNSLPYIEQTLPPLLEQKYKDIEYIYVDNGSTDGTVEYIKEKIKGNKNIKLIENGTNLGISIAKNKGVQQSTGEYLLLIDDDILIENKDFLSNIIEYYQTLNNPAFLMPLFIDKEELKDGNTRSFGTYYYPFGIQKLKPKQKIENIMAYTQPIEIAINQGGAMFIKKEIWNILGGFDESQKFNLDDDDISTRAMIYGYKNYLYNKEYIVHLGLAKRADKYRYAWNDLTYYNGKTKVIWKNFNILTAIWMGFMQGGKICAESIYHSFTLKYPKIFVATLTSMIAFLKEFPETLKKRKEIQKNRKVSDMYILGLRQPKY